MEVVIKNSLLDLENTPEIEIRRYALNVRDFAFCVQDTPLVLRLKYIHSQMNSLNDEDRLFLDSFAKFSNYYVRTNEELLSLLEEEGLYFEEDRHVVLVALCGFVLEQDQTALTYLFSSAFICSTENFLTLLSWSGLTYALVEKLYNLYPGGRTEEILLMLEGLGFDALLTQKLPHELLTIILEKAPGRKVQDTLRCTCRFLAYYEVRYRCLPPVEKPVTVKYANYADRPNSRIVTTAERMQRKTYGSNTATLISWSNYDTNEEIAQKCKVKPYIIDAIQTADLVLLEKEKNCILCQGRFDLLVSYMVSNKIEKAVLVFLLEMFMQSLQSSSIQTKKGKIKVIAKVRAVLSCSTSCLTGDVRLECLRILEI